MKINKRKNESFLSYINRIIKNMQNEKIYIGIRVIDNLITVDEKLFKKYMKNKKYDMILTSNKRVCIDINNNGKNNFHTYKDIYIPNNISREKLPQVGDYIEINILYRWFNAKKTRCNNTK